MSRPRFQAQGGITNRPIFMMQELVKPLLLSFVFREDPHPFKERSSRDGRQVEMVAKEFEEGDWEVVEGIEGRLEFSG